MNPDYIFTDCGSIWLCKPENEPANIHLRCNTPSDHIWSNGALVVEPRFLDDFVSALTANGFTCGMKGKSK